jgi:hypothetical protein
LATDATSLGTAEVGRKRLDEAAKLYEFLAPPRGPGEIGRLGPSVPGLGASRRGRRGLQSRRAIRQQFFTPAAQIPPAGLCSPSRVAGLR